MLVRVGQNYSSWRKHEIAAVMQLMRPRFCSDCTLNDWFCVFLFQALVNILLIVCALRSFAFLVCCSYYLVLSNFAMTATHDILYKQLYVKIPADSFQSKFVSCWPKLQLLFQAAIAILCTCIQLQASAEIFCAWLQDIEANQCASTREAVHWVSHCIV